MIIPPRGVLFVLDTLFSAGFPAYLVGGCVRDQLLGRTPRDWDVATAALPEDTAALFPKTVPTGAKFGTVTVLTDGLSVEVTTFRTDGDYPEGERRPKSVAFTRELTSDLSRRDFTVNAVAMGRDGALTDPFGGARDLARRVVRCVGDPDARFTEDALRMLRALRFSAELGFSIDPDTRAAIVRLAPRAKTLSRERVRDEIAKILLSPSPEALADGIRLGLLEVTVRTGEVLNLAAISSLPEESALRWCALAAMLAWAGLIGAPTAFLRAARLSNEASRAAGLGAELALAEDFPASQAAMRRLCARVGDDAAQCACAARDTLAGAGARALYAEVLQSGACRSLRDLAVDGDDLLRAGIAPGRDVGRILGALLDYVLERPEANTRDALLRLVPELIPPSRS